MKKWLQSTEYYVVTVIVIYKAKSLVLITGQPGIVAIFPSFVYSWIFSLPKKIGR